MAFSISGSVAFVTGSNRGIGRALVGALLEKGAGKVYAGARSIASLGEFTAGHGDRVVGVEIDVTNADQIATAARGASDVTLLINNAGVAGPAGIPITEAPSLQMARDQMDVNLFGTLAVSQAFSPILGANGGGALVNLVSVAGIVNFPPLATYSATKAAVHSLTQGFRFWLREQGTHVAGVYPGPVDTDMAKEIPMEKESPENVANYILTALEAGQEEIFPDAMAQGMGAGFEESPKGLEHQVTEMITTMAAA